MNELEKQLAEVVKQSLSIAEKTGEFVIDQAPALLHEFFMWHTAYNAMLVVVFIILLIVSIVGAKKGISKFDEDEAHSILTVVSFVLMGISILGFIINVFDLVKVLVAPKIYLIEYFANRLQ